MTDLELAVYAAAQGAAAITTWTGASIRPEMKGIVNPVTEADRDAEAAIVRALTTYRPADAIMAEEGGGQIGADRTWIIDPLDGTVNFVHGIPHVGVSVALYKSGQPQVGVIHDVFAKDIYTAELGRGAFLNGVPLGVSACDDVGEALVATGFPYDRRTNASVYAADLERALRSVQGIRRIGAAALDLAYVASGRFDGYWEHNVAAWDIAAGALLVTEAGGRITEVTGSELQIASFSSILATNGRIHDQLSAVLTTGR